MRVLVALVVLSVGFELGISRSLSQSPSPTAQSSSQETPTQPPDAEQIRSEIRAVEALPVQFPEHGAALFLLARRYASLGDLPKALALMKECVALDQGFDP